ncbi:hypothetical protein QVD17_20533 [Tagetes erecta]|uniref:Uncharacterized protein n=1 Tax=Tagetes erecta TaxID=13708 RepID=A0AAD8KRU2_TARER|nr:hypothetical protein QVD17_20533 [Tagetes erecta]
MPRGICYEGPHSEIQGDGNTGSGDVEFAPENMTGDSLQPVRMLDEDAPDVWKENVLKTHAEKRHQLDECESASSSKKQKVDTGKNVVVSIDKSLSPETVDAEQPGISSENVVFSELDELVGSVPELVTRYQRKAKNEARMRDQIAKLEMKVMKLKNLNKSNLVKNMFEHEKTVEALKKELEDLRDKGEIMQAHHVTECSDLQQKLGQVNKELEVDRGMVDKLKRVNRELELEKEIDAVLETIKWLKNSL